MARSLYMTRGEHRCYRCLSLLPAGELGLLDDRELQVVCWSCLAAARRLEIDAWLQQEGAIVIRVEDLGAALEARERGSHCLQMVTTPYIWPTSRAAYGGMIAQAAAHLARRALGVRS